MTKEVRSGFYVIGKITRTSGLKGEMVIKPLTDSLERFYKLNTVWLETDGADPRPFRVEKVLTQARAVRLKLEGVGKPEDAHLLVGKQVYVDEKNLIETEEGTYFIHDVLGSAVIDERGKTIGEVVEVWKLPANDVYVTRNGKREYLIPAVKTIIRSVDTKKKKIEIQTIDGLLD